MDREPIAATAVLSLVAFVFASLVGLGIALLLLAALNGASAWGLLGGGLALLIFALFAVSAIDRLHVPRIWPVLGVGVGFLGFYVWLILAFRDFGD